VTKRATLVKLQRWHDRLERAHAIAVSVSDEAEECGDLEPDEKIVIADPTVELHAALSQIEGLIDATLSVTKGE
jgi:hypothetical protein